MGTVIHYYLVAAIIRFWLLSSDYNKSIIDRIEISTPLNSWKRVKEGAVLFNEGINPYDGDLFHRTPIDLVIFTWLIHSVPSIVVDLLFIICDIITSYILFKMTCLYKEELKQEDQKSNYVKETTVSLLKKEDVAKLPVYVLITYLFNPYIILNCAARTTTVFSNLLLSTVLLSMLQGRTLLSSVLLSVCTLRSFYPWIMLVPICIYSSSFSSRKLTCNSKVLPIILPIIVFGVSLITVFFICYKIIGDWSFVENTLLFILNVPDLKPNIGLFWYFFTEMFEHFRPLFLWSFQINATVLYLIPLSTRFKDEPMLLSFSLITLITVFKSYPSIGDVGFYLSLIPMWKHLFEFMAQSFTVLCVAVCCSVFAPTVWHLWIYSGSANANFYFGVTLAFAATQIFLITDILFAYMKREFNLRNGISKSPDIKVFLS